MVNVLNTRSKKARVRVVAILLLIAALLGLGATTTANANEAPPAQNDITATLQLLEQFDWRQLIEAAINPAAQQIGPKAVAPTPEAFNVTTPNVVQAANGTGWGQPGPNVVQGDTTYVIAPYASSIIQGAPGKLGPLSFANSVQQGVNQMVANAAVNPAKNCEFIGPSQGQVVAQNAAAQVDRRACQSVHVVGQGTPGNTGNGFVTALPGNLIITQTGEAQPIGPQDTAEYSNLTGDMWGNTPDFRNLFAVVGSLISLLETGPDGTHYNPDGYANFREDLVYKTNAKGEIDPNGNVTQRVEFSENGLVILANKLGLNPDEGTKQVLRDLAPQGLPGVRNMPVTPRELVENPTPANVVNFFTGKVDETGRPVQSDIPVVGDLLGTAEQLLGGMTQNAIAPVIPEAKAIPAPGPVINNPVAEAVAPVINTLPEAFQAPVEQVVAQIPNVVPQKWVNEVLPAAPDYAPSNDNSYVAPAPQAAAPVAPVVDMVADAAVQAGVPTDAVAQATGFVNGLLGVR